MQEQRQSDTLPAAISAIKSEIDGFHRLLAEIDKRYMVKFEETNARYNQRFSFADKAVEVAETNSQRWRESSNEWRDSMNDREKKFVTVDTYETTLRNITRELSELKEKHVMSEGYSKGIDKTWATIIAAGGAGGGALLMSLLNR